MVDAAEATAGVVDQYLRIRERTRALFAIPREEAYLDRPIPLRNPIVFYEGHLPAFAINTLVKRARGEPGVDERMEQLFERGIDPAEENEVDRRSRWPSRAEVAAYVRAAEEKVIEALRSPQGAPLEAEATTAILEHELMHQETFVYMLHNLPHEMKKLSVEPGAPGPVELDGPSSVTIPAGDVVLGAERSSFAWDNEFPAHRVFVDAFEIDAWNVTNGQYLEFVEAECVRPPHFWSRRDGKWCFRGMFAYMPLPLDAPVWVTHDEASAYAAWRGKRLPTEAEYHRAFGESRYPWGDDPPDARHGNFDFRSWDPMPVGSHPAGVSPWGVHDLVGDGWEWTDTPFAGYPGFEPMPTYPQYSVDFFDGQHYVLKGASPATARELIRRSFRNWFRPNYPYVYAKFRLVSGARRATSG